MATNLTIDQGNTAAKLVVWSNGNIVAEESHHNLTAQKIDNLAARFGGQFDAAIYSTVCQRSLEVIDAVRNRCIKFIELDAATPMPLTISYATPDTLGRDRIAAAIGAWQMFDKSWILVVDCGTAITYDVVTPDKKYIGGNIAPGIFMRLEALNHYTSRLPLVETDGDCPTWGYDTETALRAGAINGVIAELNYYRNQLPEGAKIILTGGSADLVADRVSFPIIVEPHLVSKGLNCIIKYNENI